jgi:hypothetical protein
MNANIATKKIQKIMTKPIVSLIFKIILSLLNLEFTIQIISIKNKSANLALRSSRYEIRSENYWIR